MRINSRAQQALIAAFWAREVGAAQLQEDETAQLTRTVIRDCIGTFASEAGIW